VLGGRAVNLRDRPWDLYVAQKTRTAPWRRTAGGPGLTYDKRIRSSETRVPTKIGERVAESFTNRHETVPEMNPQ
jgi:hypothetical protein